MAQSSDVRVGQARRSLRAALLIGTALAGIAPTRAALAQETPAEAAQPPKGWLNIEADTGRYIENGDVFIAEGNVHITYEGRTLDADRVEYSQATGQVKATGNVVLRDPSGAAFTTQEVELTDDLREGVIKGLQAVLGDGSQLAAQSARRTDGNRTVLSYAVYSPCNVCDGEKPLWQVKARRVVHDQAEHTLRYKDAVMEVKGVPVFYLPYLEHPDPTVDRRTGLLTPGFSTDSELGIGVEMPFYWAPSDSVDFTLTPKWTTNEGIILGGEYRQNVGFGTHEFSGSITRPKDRDENNMRLDDHIIRGHLFGNGRYNLGNTWRGGFDVAYTTDDTYLRRYDISRADSLTNNFFVDHISEQELLSIDAYAFQGLRQEDVQAQIPVILPMIDYQYRSLPGWMNSVWSTESNFLALNRSDGIDMYRLSGTGSWELPFTNQLGQQFRLTASMRGDLYVVNDPERSTDADAEGRLAPSLAMDWSWPFARSTSNGLQHIIEPIASLVVAPNESNPEDIPNEDSIDVQFSELNLFRHNRSPGFDILESGTRVNYGVRYSLIDDSGIQGSMLVGQSWRLSGQSPFPANSGLDNDRSDIITSMMLSVPGLIELHHSMRLDESDLSIEKNQVQIYAGPEDWNLQLGYLDVSAQGFDTSLPHREEINLGAYAKLSDQWSANGSIIQSFDKNVGTIEWAVGVAYQSRCIRLETTLRRNYAEDRDIRPSTSVYFKIALANLGM